MFLIEKVSFETVVFNPIKLNSINICQAPALIWTVWYGML